MINDYAIDPNFKDVMSKIALRKKSQPFNVQDVFILYGNRLCVKHSLHKKLIYKSHDSLYEGYRGIQAMLKRAKMFFYRSTMKKDIMAYVSSCMIYQKVKYNRRKH